MHIDIYKHTEVTRNHLILKGFLNPFPFFNGKTIAIFLKDNSEGNWLFLQYLVIWICNRQCKAPPPYFELYLFDHLRKQVAGGNSFACGSELSSIFGLRTPNLLKY